MSAPNTPTTLDLPLEDREATTWSSVTISLHKIIDDDFNPRKDFGEHDGTFAALVASIRERGMLQPPLVRPVSSAAETQYHVVAGHRRIAAARALGWDAVRCTPVEDSEGNPADYTDSERLIDALVENLQRKELNCIEVAEGIARLEKLGKTQADIARWIGRDQGRVSKTVRLLELPIGVRALLRDGGLSQSHGEELLPLLGESFLPGEIELLAMRASTDGLSRNGLRNVVQDKIKRSQPVQTTIEEVEEPSGDYAPAHNSQVDKSEHVKSQESAPKPTPKEDNGLTRKDADAQFAAAMAPDPDVVPLSERPGADNPIAKGTFFFLPADVAELLFELATWHRQEHGLITADEKLADIVRSFHQAKLEQRAEAEAAKAALVATLPVFEVPEVQEQEIFTITNWPTERRVFANAVMAAGLETYIAKDGVCPSFVQAKRFACTVLYGEPHAPAHAPKDADLFLQATEDLPRLVSHLDAGGWPYNGKPTSRKDANKPSWGGSVALRAELKATKVEVATPEEIERGVMQLKDDAIEALFTPAQGVSSLIDDMVGRLV